MTDGSKFRQFRTLTIGLGALLAFGCSAVIDDTAGGQASAGASGAGSEPRGGSGAGAGQAAAGSGTSAGAPGTLGPLGTLCASPGPSASFAPLRRLSNEEYSNTIAALIGAAPANVSLPPDEVVGSFRANTYGAASSAAIESYYRNAERLASELTAKADELSALAACGALQGEACASSFVRDFGARAFRRPLATAEEQAFFQVYRAGATRGGFAGGIRLVLMAMLSSPYFLYHTELSPAGQPGPVLLGPYEVAARLSYFLTAAPPDADLRRAAQMGELSSAAQVRAQAERLLASPAAEKSLRSFHQQWLKLTDLQSVEKDSALFPAWSPELAASMEQETARFVAYVFQRGDGLFKSLVSAPYSFVDAGLGALYGVTPAADSNQPTPLDASQRAGLLTQGAFLASKAHVDRSSPVRRGVSVLSSFFCSELPPPPADVMATAPEPAGNKTTRELYADHSKDARCRGCHSLIDPVGFGLEKYDAIGRFRANENGLPIDDSGEIVNIDPSVNGTFHGAPELAARISESPVARDCYATALLTFALKRRAGLPDACSAKGIAEAFAASGYSVRELMLKLVEQDAFRYAIAESAAQTGSGP